MEAALGVRFPLEFRTFLEEVGWLDTAEVSVYGAGSGTVPYANLGRLTLDEQSGRSMPVLPHHLVPVSPDGMGGHFCLVCDPDRPDFGHVVYVDHEHEEVIPEPITDSFTAWLCSAFAGDPWMYGEDFPTSISLAVWARFGAVEHVRGQ